MRFRQPMPSAALLLLFACAPQSAEQKGPELCAQEVEAAKASCHAEIFGQLERVSNHLEGVLNSNPISTFKSETAPSKDPEQPPIDEGPVIPQATSQDLALAFAEIEQMAQGVSRQFEDLVKVQKDLRREVELLRRDSTASIDEAREALLKQGEELGAQFSEDQTDRGQLEDLRRELESERRQFQGQARQLADLVRAFDRTKLTCDGCGKGISGRVGRDILSFHGELLAQLEALEGTAE
jgi:hypothetical protein